MPTKNRQPWRPSRKGLYWSGLLVGGSVAVFLGSSECLLGRGCSGADGRGFWLGLVSTLALAFTLLYSLRKDRPKMWFSLEQWLYSHVVVGVIALELAIVHSGYWLSDTVAALALLFLLLTVLTGVAGLFLVYFLPQSQARSETAVLLPGDLYSRLSRLHDEIFTLCSESGGVLLTVYNELVIPLYATPIGAGVETLPSADVSPWAGRVTDEVSEQFMALAAKVEEAHDVFHLLGKSMRFQWWMRGWLLLHVPSTIGLVVFTVVHIVAMTWYGAP